MTVEGAEPPRTPSPEIWGNVPQRNRHFTGREDLLAELRRRADAEATAVVPTAFYGLGGVGKTQLAIEYAYRYADRYQVVWWIPADQVALVRSSLAALAPRLGLSDIPPGRIQDAVVAVLDALRRGQPYDRWLVVFDNADDPKLIRDLMPHGPGHVIVTSRNRGWDQVVDALEIDVFTREESRSYLERRVPGISPADADRLADELGDLPLALEQAAALMTETVMSVNVYLDLLSEEGDRVLGEGPPPTDYPLPVAAAWSLSVARLREQTPYAMELLQRCAFFGPAPIPLDLLDRGRYVLGPPLQETLRDQILMGRAIRALGRYSLVRIDNYRRSLEVHRIIQRLIRNELEPEDRESMKHEVHLLLAASDPGEPGNVGNWPKYAELLAHVGPAEIVTCAADWVRRLALNIVGYLLVTGDHASALTSADKALGLWSAASGEDDKSVLIMARLKSQTLRALGHYRESHELAGQTLERMRAVFGDDHEETLILLNGRCIDLRATGDFKASLALNQELLERHRAVFGSDHPRTLEVMNNLAEDFELNSDYAAARDLNEKLYEYELVVYLRDSHPHALFTLNARARIMREEGQYAAALITARRAYEGYQDLVRQHVMPEGHPWVLQQAIDFSAALRAAGDDSESLDLAKDVYEKYRRAFGRNHPSTLASAVNLANIQRIRGDLEQAEQLLEATAKDYQDLFGATHPYALGSALNLSITHRRLGKAETAKQRLAEIHAVLNEHFGPDQHPTLICAVNLANALADAGDVASAVELCENALPKLTELLGQDHPHTLTCAGNLALDLKAAGQTERAAALASDTIARYRRTLGEDHPETRAVEVGERQDLGIEVPVLF